MFSRGFPSGSTVKNLPAMQETQERQLPSLGQEVPLLEQMTTHYGILARKIPWMQELGRLQTVGSQKVRHD